tara:strand:+ start:1177 stop:1488 length:312 start_codon:yes stop_codon:yes gene_type:complete
MHKKTLYLITLIFLLTSCGTMDSVKRGLTGEKELSTDEFLVKKKMPLILPPNYENLPLPSESEFTEEETFSLSKTIEVESSEELTSSKSNSNEESILKKIKQK